MIHRVCDPSEQVPRNSSNPLKGFFSRGARETDLICRVNHAPLIRATAANAERPEPAAQQITIITPDLTFVYIGYIATPIIRAVGSRLEKHFFTKYRINPGNNLTS